MIENLPLIVSVCTACFCGWLFIRRGVSGSGRSESFEVALSTFVLVALGVAFWALVTHEKSKGGGDTPEALYAWRTGSFITIYHPVGFIGGAIAAAATARERNGDGPSGSGECDPAASLFLAAFSLFATFMVVAGSGIATLAIVDPAASRGHLAYGLVFTSIALSMLFFILIRLSETLHGGSAEKDE